ncbi:hypothetical protein B0H66DRAFT_604990 [Apodospora peruviana]|uniref:FAD synthase n=1 Tax=Apodospora peruviana TaxID=516989 RepID=A0AAE0M3M6_9PEZI|nr:hypothetical protein B0H66DRAFT_604990 [Apodospora peruviana]
MTQDTRSYQDAPRTNGINGVAKASATAPPLSTSTSARNPPHRRKLPDICYTLRRKLIALVEEQTDDLVLRGVQDQARVSMRIIEEAIRKYEPEELSLAYNGGKDCLVLLVLILACLPSAASESSPSASQPTSSSSPLSPTPPEQSDFKTANQPGSKPPPLSEPPQPLQAIYIAPPDPFPEVEDFVAASTVTYHLDLSRYALPMRPALEAYLSSRTAVKAIFMGTRRTDPHSEFLEHFSPTDKDWPQFMRVNPVIDWHYTEIWTFIRHMGIPFCSLYDRGFSSLGGMSNTRPNPALAVDGDGFKPAYELVRDDEERLGRDR